MMLGLEMGWRELFPPTQPTVATAELEHSIFFLAESTLRAACSEIYPVCQVSTEETGKQVGFDVICNRRQNN